MMILETGMPALVVGLFCAGALSASMSTGDALLHAAASVAVEDGLGPFTDLPEERQTGLMRVILVVVAIVAYYYAVTDNQSLVVLLLTAYGIIAQLAPTVFASLYWRRATTAGVLAGLIAGSATAVFFYFNPELRILDMHEGILGLVVHLPVLVAVSLATAPQDDAHVDAFVRQSAAGPTP